MAFDLNFHCMASITARLVEPLPGSEVLGKSEWIRLSINTLDGQSFVLTCFFSGTQLALAKAYADAINGAMDPSLPLDAVRGAITDYHRALDRFEHGGVAAARAVEAIQSILQMPWVQGATIQPAPVTEETCPGHIASDADPKVCGRCGTHIDSLRPPEDQPEPEVIF